MTRRQIKLACDALKSQQSLCLRLAATCEPEEVADFTEQAEACAEAFKLLDGLDQP